MKVIKKFAIKNTSELQTPTKNKSVEPSLSPACRRTSPRYKKVPEDDCEPAQLRRTPRNTKGTEPSAAVSPCVTTPKRRRQFESVTLSSPPTKRENTRKNNVQFESAQHTQSIMCVCFVYITWYVNVSVYIIWVCEWIFQLH